METDLEACLTYETEDGRSFTARFAPADGFADGRLAVQPSLTEREGGFRLELCLSARRPLTLIRFQVKGGLPAWADRETLTLANGFQSWSRTEEFLPHRRQRKLSRLAFFLGPYGEPFLAPLPRGPGRFHGWWLTHLRGPGHALLLGSTDERSGFTLMEVDRPGGVWRARKDCGGRRLEEGEEYRLCGLFLGEGPDLAALYDEFARASGIAPPARTPRTAWLSWYYYYTRVGAEEIRRVLAGLKELEFPLDFFIIDDGYEPAVGDWLSPGPRFPEGPAPLAAEIRAAGYTPGIWTAPFVVERRSALWREHPGWILRTAGGKPVPAGMNPNWSGTFFALDLSRPEPREYVREVIRTVRAWGFRLIKLDFAYAACLRPTPRRTRGELMAGALDLVREAAGGDAVLLGCGVPLGSAPGAFDYCRIGPDVAPYWDDRELRLLGYPERVATENALCTVLNRSFLAGRLLAADPDACLLRARATRLTPHQRRSLFLLTCLCGRLFSFSDPPDLLGLEERALLDRAFPPAAPVILDHRRRGGLHELHLDNLGDRFLVLANLAGRSAEWPLAPEWRGMLFFDQLEKALILPEETPSLRLAPYETRLFKINSPGPTQVAGTSLHLLGGKADVREVRITPEGEISLTLAEGLRAAGDIWLALGAELPAQISYRGLPLTVKEKGRFRLVRFRPER